jgi:hypothetical protein
LRKKDPGGLSAIAGVLSSAESHRQVYKESRWRSAQYLILNAKPSGLLTRDEARRIAVNIAKLPDGA